MSEDLLSVSKYKWVKTRMDAFQVWRAFREPWMGSDLEQEEIELSLQLLKQAAEGEHFNFRQLMAYFYNKEVVSSALCDRFVLWTIKGWLVRRNFLDIDTINSMLGAVKKIHDAMSQPFKAIAPSHLKGRICFAETQRLLADPKLFHRFFVKVLSHEVLEGFPDPLPRIKINGISLCEDHCNILDLRDAADLEDDIRCFAFPAIVLFAFACVHQLSLSLCPWNHPKECRPSLAECRAVVQELKERGIDLNVPSTLFSGPKGKGHAVGFYNGSEKHMYPSYDQFLESYENKSKHITGKDLPDPMQMLFAAWKQKVATQGQDAMRARLFTFMHEGKRELVRINTMRGAKSRVQHQLLAVMVSLLIVLFQMVASELSYVLGIAQHQAECMTMCPADFGE